jgi:3-isopropylmalate/(R)-2-methylmalate dehydratase large subunit
MSARTLYDKLWDDHVIQDNEDGSSLLFIDRQLLHEVSSPQAFEGLRRRGCDVWAPEANLCVADHAVPTRRDGREIADPLARDQVALLERNAREAGVRYIEIDGDDHGIVHVIGPELGFTLPGLSLVCGDSHTATHGAFGALAFGIGASECECVLATRTLRQTRARNMRAVIDGELQAGVVAKDVILHLISRIGASGGTGFAVEYCGEAVRAMSMEARMTLCNMSIEAGARIGLVAPDETTLAYIKGRPLAPKGEHWMQAARVWRTLASDADARFDKTVSIDAARLAPQATWGVSPDQACAITDSAPDPAACATADETARTQRALDYMGLSPGQRLTDVAIDTVFIGSCTNGRIEDLRAAANLLKGLHVAPGVTALAVPGSARVKQAAEAEGLDRVFLDAGFQWRQSGCSLCVAMNNDRLPAGARCASTSNRNFEGRQGPQVRTHLMSPLSAAATAIAGRLADPRPLMRTG